MSREREALRQQMLLRALWQDARPGVVAGWMHPPRGAPAALAAGFARGLQAYQANGRALAERALVAAYPVLQQLIGEESFAAMARAFWHSAPPQAGDMALWGEALPRFVEDAEQLADEPYLADVARVEWALHRAAFAADAPATPQGLARLGDEDPAALRLALAPGAALVVSPHPVVSIWQAHRQPPDGGDTDRFAAVRRAFAESRGEAAFVCRQGLAPTLHPAGEAERPFLAALLDGMNLADALSRTGAGFDFSAWLIKALGQRWIASVQAD